MLFYQDKDLGKVEFFPLSMPNVDDELDKRPLSELPDVLFGKVMMGVAGYNPIWKYITINKQDIEEIEEKEEKSINKEYTSE